MRKRVIDWLRRLPIGDPVDRRNAFFMQLLLLYSGCKIPLNQLYLLRFDPGYVEMFEGRSAALPASAAIVDLVAELLLAASAWIGFYLIRKGRFREAVTLFLGAMILTSLALYATFGYHRWTGDLMTIEALAVSSLMLGRRALWWIYPAFMASYAVGMTRDYLFDPDFHQVSAAYTGLLPTVFSYLVLVLILDRASTALRASLAESNERGLQLQREMAERERAQEELLHAQKMDAVGMLASGVAHDFGNVLGIILGFALERHRLDEPDAERSEDALALAQALEGVEMAARRGASVSRKLLNLSRSDVTRPEVFDAGEALRELRPLLRQLLAPSVRLAMETDGTPLPILFDRSQFELALLNIASNARDALPEGGRFRVAAGSADGFASLTLEDDGTGMPDEVKAKIFEPFFTTKPVGKGTGLGLAVVHRLVLGAGGTISVESQPGRGTRFHLSLPLVQASDAPPSPLPDDGVHVMLIDDDDDLRQMLAAALTRSGCVVTMAAGGGDALRIVEQERQVPDVIVCDNRMPDIDGATLLRRLRLTLPGTPAILISAYLETDGQPPEALDAFTTRLPKPFAPDRLVDGVLRAASARRETAPQI